MSVKNANRQHSQSMTRTSRGEQLRRATCFDALGRKLVESTEARMYVGRLAGGTYLIRVETTTGQVYGKMLVKP